MNGKLLSSTAEKVENCAQLWPWQAPQYTLWPRPLLMYINHQIDRWRLRQVMTFWISSDIIWQIQKQIFKFHRENYIKHTIMNHSKVCFPKATMVTSSIVTNRVQWNLQLYLNNNVIIVWFIEELIAVEFWTILYVLQRTALFEMVTKGSPEG